MHWGDARLISQDLELIPLPLQPDYFNFSWRPSSLPSLFFFIPFDLSHTTIAVYGKTIYDIFTYAEKYN